MGKLPNTYLKAYVAMKEAFEQGLPVDIVATGPDTRAAQHALQQAVTLFAELVTARGKTMEYHES
jgi:hypothetical protein